MSNGGYLRPGRGGGSLDKGYKKKFAGTHDPPKSQFFSFWRFEPKILGNFDNPPPKNCQTWKFCFKKLASSL